MLTNILFSFIALGCLLANAQTTVDLGNQGRNADFSQFPYVYPAPMGASLPLTCNVGNDFILTNVYPTPTTGALYICSAPNTWTQAGGSSSNATSILGIPITAGATDQQTLVYNSGTNHWIPITPSGAAYTAGTGLLLSSSVFSLDTTYTDAHYANLGNVNLFTQQSTPGVAPSAGFVKVYAKTGTNQICVYNSSGVETCNTTGTAVPGGSDKAIGYNNNGSFGGFLNASATKGYVYQTNSGNATFQLVPIPIADGGTNGTTKAGAFDSLSPLTTLGDLLYGGASGTGTRLAGNTTIVPQVMITTGDGVNAAAPTLGPFVSTVNGQSGAVTVATGNFQTWMTNAGTLTNRAKAKFVGTGGTTVTSTDNGTDTQTLTINSSSTATPAASGSTLPGGTCDGTHLGNLYTRTGAANNSNSSGSDFWVCSNTLSGFRWALQTTHKVNVMSYGCKADSVTNDQACFQNAINDAKLLTNYPSSGIWGAEVYIPNGRYLVTSPIILPRSGNSTAGVGNGGVNLIGESPSGVVLDGSSSFPMEVNEAYILYPGSGYTSIPTITFGSGCSVAPVALAATLTRQYLVKITLASNGTGCTSMPSCTVSGGGGSGATCETVGRAIIEWDQVTAKRNVLPIIKNIQFIEPRVIGTMSIHFKMIQKQDIPSSSGTSTEDERFEGATFENLFFLGSDSYNPISFYIGGDCIGCLVRNVSGNPATGTGLYENIMLATDAWFDGSTTDEGAGFNEGSQLVQLAGGGNRGGYSASFQGRIARSSFKDGFCDGMFGGKSNSECYAFFHSAGNIFEALANEGKNDDPQILFVNSNDNKFHSVGMGSPQPTAGNGMNLIASSGNEFDGHLGGVGVSFPSIGKVAVSLDATSHNNSFLNWQSNGGIANDVSVADLQTNWFQSCNSTDGTCTNGPFTTFGYQVGRPMVGTGTKPTCNASTRGAMWPVRNGSGVKDQVQVCLQTGSGTTLAWTTIF